MALRRPRREQYTVGWICALQIELAAAVEMLDEKHHKLERRKADQNTYVLGSVGNHNVAITCLPAGLIGSNIAAVVVGQMMSTFESMEYVLMVGVGGGVPSAQADIRLGDVVVSQPHQGNGGVIQYDCGKSTPTGFQRIGFLNSPPRILLSAVQMLREKERRRESKLPEYVSELRRLPWFTSKDTGRDVLFEPTYDHETGPTCQHCNPCKQVDRPPRPSEEPQVFYGTIASGNRVVKNAAERDCISKELGGVLCFEMEAAGLMNSFPCLVIRGISDYADSHKNKQWQPYAARTAAAWAKELLSQIPPLETTKSNAQHEGLEENLRKSGRRGRNTAEGDVVDETSSSDSEAGGGGVTDWSDLQCYSCQGYGHFRKSCPNRTVRTCHNCGKRGHLVSTCTREPLNCYRCGIWGHREENCYRFR